MCSKKTVNNNYPPLKNPLFANHLYSIKICLKISSRIASKLIRNIFKQTLNVNNYL